MPPSSPIGTVAGYCIFVLQKYGTSIDGCFPAFSLDTGVGSLGIHYVCPWSLHCMLGMHDMFEYASPVHTDRILGRVLRIRWDPLTAHNNIIIKISSPKAQTWSAAVGCFSKLTGLLAKVPGSLCRRPRGPVRLHRVGCFGGRTVRGAPAGGFRLVARFSKWV